MEALIRDLAGCFEGLDDPLSQDVPACSCIQTLMRVSGNNVLEIPSHVLTASNSCDSQREAVC